MSKSFRNEALVVQSVVLASKIRCFSKNNFHNIKHPYKGFQKNMLKVWHFTKDKTCHRHFDNNLQKSFRTNILGDGTRQIDLVVVLMFGLWLKVQMEIVD